MSIATPEIDPMYDAGDFKTGDRVRVTSTAIRHNGALGTVMKVDPEFDEDTRIPFRVVVWLDVFRKPSAAEAAGRVGLPLMASEIEKVEK